MSKEQTAAEEELRWPYDLTAEDIAAENVGEFFPDEVSAARNYIENGQQFCNGRDEGLLAAGIVAEVVTMLMRRMGTP